jgi:hypothetical protein
VKFDRLQCEVIGAQGCRLWALNVNVMNKLIYYIYMIEENEICFSFLPGILTFIYVHTHGHTHTHTHTHTRTNKHIGILQKVYKVSSWKHSSRLFCTILLFVHLSLTILRVIMLYKVAYYATVSLFDIIS